MPFTDWRDLFWTVRKRASCTVTINTLRNFSQTSPWGETNSGTTLSRSLQYYSSHDAAHIYFYGGNLYHTDNIDTARPSDLLIIWLRIYKWLRALYKYVLSTFQFIVFKFYLKPHLLKKFSKYLNNIQNTGITENILKWDECLFLLADRLNLIFFVAIWNLSENRISIHRKRVRKKRATNTLSVRYIFFLYIIYDTLPDYNLVINVWMSKTVRMPMCDKCICVSPSSYRGISRIW